MMKNILLLCSCLTVSGCTSFSYYLDLMEGHSELLEQRRSITDILLAKETSPELQQLLKTSVKIRDFASNDLYLPENESYRLYADLKRPYAVWNVVATEAFSTNPKTWCFLFVGCLSYRGYFSKKAAMDYAAVYKQQGYDVYVGGAKAYSTLGWFDDPLLNTMMYKSEALRAGIIFHELAHQIVYIEDDSAFNEAFATAVEQVGIQRWFEKKGLSQEYTDYLQSKQRDNQFNALLRSTRNKLKQLYSRNIEIHEKWKLKKQIFSTLLLDYESLKKSWSDYDGFDKWVYQGLNNAHLALIATYHDLVPAFKRLLQQQNFDLKKFYRAVAELGKLDKDKRNIKLQQLKLLK